MADYTRHLVQIEVSHIGDMERTPNIRNILPINGILVEANNGLRFVLGFYRQNNCVSDPKIEKIIGVENFDSTRNGRGRCDFVVGCRTSVFSSKVTSCARFCNVVVLAESILPGEFPGRRLENSQLVKATPYTWNPQAAGFINDKSKYSQGEPFFCAKSPCGEECQKLLLASKFDKEYVLFSSDTPLDVCGYPIYDGNGRVVAIGLDSVEIESGHILSAIKMTELFAAHEHILENTFH